MSLEGFSWRVLAPDVSLCQGLVMELPKRSAFSSEKDQRCYELIHSQQAREAT